MFTEEKLLELLKVQSNLNQQDFIDLFGGNKGKRLFGYFARDNWNLISFMFNKINRENRKKLLQYINDKKQ